MADSAPLALDWTHMSCVDPNCRIRQARSSTHTSTETANRSNTIFYQGKAVFCLVEPDPDWFQGYFLCSQLSSVPLVCVKQPLDECLECKLGGYRVVTVTLQIRGQPETKIQDVEWTGGDMARLDHPHLRALPLQCKTGASAVPLVQKLFSRLVQQCSDNGNNNDVLDVFPDVSVVEADMVLMLPRLKDSDDFLDEDDNI